jgi:ribA/ribD-fused uncharacterized protein
MENEMFICQDCINGNNTPKIIDEFRGEYDFLSNFYPCKVFMLNDLTKQLWTVPTAEHAFQMSKTKDLKEQKIIMACKTAGEAKKAGRKVTLRDDWESIKLKVMYEVVYSKFSMDDNLKSRLLATGDAKLIEGNNWGDFYWGVCRGVGENHLGKILMRVREEMKNENQ